MKRLIKGLLGFLVLICITGCGLSLEEQIQRQLDLGNHCLIEGIYEEAIVAFQKVIELEPKNAEAYKGLGRAYQNQSKNMIDENKRNAGLEYLRLALEAYEMAKEIDPSDENIQEELNIIYEEIENIEYELKLLDSINMNEAERNIQDYVELIKTIEQLCNSEAYDQVFELMNNEIFTELQKLCADHLPLIFTKEGNKGLGFYSDGYVYYGEYENEIRKGEGIWLHCPDGEETYFSQGIWDQDLPNGYFEEESVSPDWTFTRTGNVVDGVWNGEAQEKEIFEDGTWTGNVSFTMGKYDVLDTYEEGGETYYVLSESEYNGEDNYGDIVTLDPEAGAIVAVSGFEH